MSDTQAQAGTVVIIGAGPAGLTAAYELARGGRYKPVVLESSAHIGGISRTVEYRGNRMDIGGHRFFSKNDVVMDWWLEMMPLQGRPAGDDLALGREVLLSDAPGAPDPEHEDRVMLSRSRLSRILFMRKFIDYPLSLNLRTSRALGAVRIARFVLGYLAARVRPVRDERTLEDFLINRFGVPLYEAFFKDYTRKVWGVPCSGISREWGAQRIKGLSLRGTIAHALRQAFSKDDSLRQKSQETSLIGRFLYPKLGPGQLWEEVALRVEEMGGEIRHGARVVGLDLEGGRVAGVAFEDGPGGEVRRMRAAHVVSTMPVRDLVDAMPEEAVPGAVREVAGGLVYRDFMTAGILVRGDALVIEGKIARDNWIYVQEHDIRMCRIQVFNNWSPYLVARAGTVWLGLEYMCDEGGELWSMPDENFIRLAVGELEAVGVVRAGDVLDSVVLRVPKAYPAYFGSYDRFDEVRGFLDGIANLYPVGRNGMHRYNNMDHSMLSAMKAVAVIEGREADKTGIWRVNAESEYHEEAG